MKNNGFNRFVIGLVLIIGTFAWADNAEYRTFTDSNGKEITASILKYDAKAGKVMLKIKGSEKEWVPLSSLSGEDQTYASEWYGRARFLSDDLFEIDVDEEDSRWKRGIGPLVDERHSRFVIELSNQKRGQSLNLVISD